MRKGESRGKKVGQEREGVDARLDDARCGRSRWRAHSPCRTGDPRRTTLQEGGKGQLGPVDVGACGP